MKYLLVILVIIAPSISAAAEHLIKNGTGTNVPLNVDYLKETMIVLPENALSVTGAREPLFQVEPGGDYVMVRPLKQGEHGNLFINFGNRTVVSLRLTTVNTGGEQLVTLRYGSPPDSGVVSGKGVPGGDLDLKSFAVPWNVKKLGSKSKNAGFSAVAQYAITVGERVLLNFSVKNNGNQVLNVSNISLVRSTLGGLKGTAVLDTVEIPSQCSLDVRSLSPGEEVYGTLLFSKTYVDFDQTLILKIQNEVSEGPELWIRI